MIDEFLDAFYTYNSDEVIDYKIFRSFQNKVVLLRTNNSSFIVKQYSNDAIGNESDLEIRKEQIRISKIWQDNGIPCILPLTDIFKYNDHYYVIYPYTEGNVYDEGELNLEQIKKIAYYQAKIHKMNITSTLSHHLRKINFSDDRIQNIIDLNNKYLEIGLSEKVICHNDYKPLNIIWVDDEPIIVDFDAVSYNHPSFSLLESAYTMSHDGADINLSYYEEYIKTYLEEYGSSLKDVREAIYGSWNGKLQWLEYLTNSNRGEETNDLINQIINYENYIDDIKKIITNLNK